MKKIALISLTTAMAGLLAAPALAQDGAGDWTGPYVGGSLGMAWQPNYDRDTLETLTFDTNNDGNYGDTVSTAVPGNAFAPGFCRGRALGATPGSCAGDKDRRVAWGVHAGYDMQMGNFVVGAVIEGGRTMIGNSVSGFSTTPASYVLSRRIDWDANARLRAGLALGTGTLIYGTGGVAYAKIKNNFATSNTFNTFTESNESADEWGWTAGGGIEQRVSQNFSIGVQYRYTRFNTDGYTVRAGQGTPPSLTNPFVITPAGFTDIQRTNDVFDHHTVRATASFRF
ncbi:outer membrane immunogenic protein [Sphingobium sp. B2D3A]|uniref:outer membrane protein n=1 Tax=unclassified Sphingobium TaxID=2611147 RepID=UPI002224CA71|nr:MULTISPECIES: outer membrane beta-barrel protein [unclassified Sphingobium]MCW2338898.1 outer membrane immunogenic protein [Sphingobium sp. B2D3A]MCW2349716.1 outer membrane immunogenic protein [Sphingobium sp. B12D2B]MCW2368820.1 outer membrane immunogenic protein [Sphingobium sp. B11D3D]MCW2382470.1 outer membrane immunogenic protein [Sphingobium sp. B2D3B]MCW2385323.1 outer membrane immunogenic protein [Sphingobium sp. B2D3D]